jgi:hypothetical protein
MSKEENNKAIVGRWFTDFWGKTCNLGIVDVEEIGLDDGVTALQQLGLIKAA